MMMVIVAYDVDGDHHDENFHDGKDLGDLWSW